MFDSHWKHRNESIETFPYRRATVYRGSLQPSFFCLVSVLFVLCTAFFVLYKTKRQKTRTLHVRKPGGADSARHSPEIIFLSPQSCSVSPNHQQPFFIPEFADIDFLTPKSSGLVLSALGGRARSAREGQNGVISRRFAKFSSR